MKKVMAFGSFDILHKGHEAYLKEAKGYGDYLIVIVSNDNNFIKFKGRKPKNNEEYRLKQVRKLDFIDKAVLGNKDDIFKVLEDYKPDVICLGYDQSTMKEKNIEEFLNKNNIKSRITRAKAFKPEIYKSSKFEE